MFGVGWFYEHRKIWQIWGNTRLILYTFYWEFSHWAEAGLKKPNLSEKAKLMLSDVESVCGICLRKQTLGRGSTNTKDATDTILGSTDAKDKILNFLLSFSIPWVIIQTLPLLGSICLDVFAFYPDHLGIALFVKILLAGNFEDVSSGTRSNKKKKKASTILF